MQDIVTTLTLYVFVAIFSGVIVTWILLIKSMLNSFKNTPNIDSFKLQNTQQPKVSVILPARNEELFIKKCLDSLLNQDYDNYEIIAIDDSSEDDTGRIIKEYSEKHSKVIHVKARPKPDGWMGKNWACMEGYKEATGGLLLFTDSDTKHSRTVISLATHHLLSANLDALTAIPKMLSLDLWTKITLPMISTFLHSRFSALRVNNPSKKTGYFFGSFFIIRKQAYEKAGTHEGVKHEIIEDGALGRKVKEQGFKMRMVRGDNLIEAVWARDLPTLWNALKRLMVPLYLQSRRIAVGIFIAVLFLLFGPFPATVYSLAITESPAAMMLFIVSLSASCLIYVAAAIEVRELQIKQKYTLLCPLGALIVVGGFLSGILQVKSKHAVEWRGRKYSMKDNIQKSIQV